MAFKLLSVAGVLVLLSVLVVLSIVQRAYKALTTPLRHLPGPLLARFSRWWLFGAIGSRNFQTININLHKKYGVSQQLERQGTPSDVFSRSNCPDWTQRVQYRRLGSGTSHLQTPRSTDQGKHANGIYPNFSNQTDPPQSSRYSAWGLPDAEPNLLTQLDVQAHADRRRQINSIYSTSALLNIEYHVDDVLKAFLEKLDGFAKAGATVDMSEWLQLYTFDTIGALTVDSPIPPLRPPNLMSIFPPSPRRTC